MRLIENMLAFGSLREAEAKRGDGVLAVYEVLPIEKGMSHISRVNASVCKPVFFKGKDAGRFVGIFFEPADPPASPGPHLGRDVIKNGYSQILGAPGEMAVPGEGINQHDRVGPILEKMAFYTTK